MSTLPEALAAKADLMAVLGGVHALTAGGAGNIVGAEVGIRQDGAHVVRVFVREDIRPDDARTHAWGGVPVERVSVGVVRPMVVRASGAGGVYTGFERPAKCGSSVGHYRITAGTIGALVELADRRLAMLSNNHVLADVNRAQPGDLILQPGAVDGGRISTDVAGHLIAFTPISWAAPNAVDCAVAWGQFARESPSHHTYTLSPEPIAPLLGMTVRKEGRTTGLTRGTIVGIDADIAVDYGPEGGQASFAGQVRIQGLQGPFSRPGDSGSLIVSDSGLNPVALLFSGGTGPDGTESTFACPIQSVMQALAIDRFLDAIVP